MSEDPQQLPGEPEASGSQETPASEPQAPESQPTPAEPAALQPSEQVQYPPVPEVYIQPAPAAPAAQPQYPPTPEAYALQQPVLQNPYTQQPPVLQNPYAVPNGPATPGMPYGAPQADNTVPPFGYGAPGFPPQPPYGYGYEQVPQAQPLPLGQAIRELPGQYKKVLLKPGARTFAEEQGKAEWGIIWTQVLFLTLFQVLVSIALVIFGGQSSSTAVLAPGLPSNFFSTVLQFEAVILVILTPAFFFAGEWIQYLFAKMFKGQGLFKQQVYNHLLFQVPFGVISTALSVIVSPLTRQMSANMFTRSLTTAPTAPLFSPGVLLALLLLDVISLAIFVYSIVLNVYSIMAAHRLSGGKASGVVLIPFGILVFIGALAFCGLFIFAISAATANFH